MLMPTFIGTTIKLTSMIQLEEPEQLPKDGVVSALPSTVKNEPSFQLIVISLTAISSGIPAGTLAC